MALSKSELRRIAGLELNAQLAAGAIPAEIFDGARISGSSTLVHDINGEVLFHRFVIRRERKQVAFADIAVHEVMGHPFLAASTGVLWDEKNAISEAEEALRKSGKDAGYDEARIVAYSYPKIAVQFLKSGEEVAMLEWGTWAEVPRYSDRKEGEPPGNFERWSVLEGLPEEYKKERYSEYEKRIAMWAAEDFGDLDVSIIERDNFRDIIRVNETYDVHYSSHAGDHDTCFELRGQETNVWCVGASAQMLLLFYRYDYTQTRLAVELGLGTPNNPNGLPYSQVGRVVTVVEQLTSNALDCTMLTNPVWNDFYTEIKANRPMISFVPGHSRCVAGYTRSLLNFSLAAPYRGLLVYDPWPPNMGVITRWENFATQTYQFAYKSVLKHV